MCARAVSAAIAAAGSANWWRDRCWSAIPATNTSAPMTTSAATNACRSSLVRNWWKRSATAGDVWQIGSVPPLPELMVLGELAQTAADGNSDVGLDEVGQVLASRFVEVVSGQAAQSRPGEPRATAAARWKRRCGSTPIRIGRSIWRMPPTKPASARSISCGCSRTCSASPRTNIWCARGCAMRRGGWPTTTARSPISPMTSALATSPISCAPSIAPPAPRR